MVFADLIWREYQNLPPLTPVQREICDWLQYGPKRCQIHAFRGAGKSYLTAAYALWLLLRNPEEMILVISATSDRSDAFVQFVRRLLYTVPFLAHLRPNRARRDRDKATQFDVGACTPKQSPSVKAIGVTGQMAGSRATVVIMDDVEIPNNSMTPSQREKLSEIVKEVDAILLPDSEELKVESKVRVLGTPQSMETVYLQLEERGYEPRVWPILLPEKEVLAGYRGHLAPELKRRLEEGEPAGSLVEPSRFTQMDVEERRVSYGALGFALQFMLSTALSDAERYPLKTRDLIVADYTTEKAREFYVHSRHPQNRLNHIENYGMSGDGFFASKESAGDWIPYERSVVAVDPSGRGKDETAIVSGTQLRGSVFLQGLMGSLDGYSEEALKMIAYEAKRVKADTVIVESNYGDGMFTRLLTPVLKNIYPCKVEEIKHHTMKERRIIDVLSPALEAHKIIVNTDFIEKDQMKHAGDSESRARDRMLFYQMTHLTDERGCLPHDDRLDCLALLIAYFSKYMSIDPHEEARRRAALKEEEWFERAFRPQTSNSWIGYVDQDESPLYDLLP